MDSHNTRVNYSAFVESDFLIVLLPLFYFNKATGFVVCFIQ